MARILPRIPEARMDVLFAELLLRPSVASALALRLGLDGPVTQIHRQKSHLGASGSIDLWLKHGSGILLIENKIDATWSVTMKGENQPDRYRASVAALCAMGVQARSVLLAPESYLAGSAQASSFDLTLPYEAFLPLARDEERALLLAAIAQATAPYEPAQDHPTASFFARFRSHVATHWPDLVMKVDPNADGVRPTGSHTFYFDVPRTLAHVPHLPKPRMSLQAWDSGAASASVKIMLGGMADLAKRIEAPAGLRARGGYLRPAGGSLGFVIDTPRLDVRQDFDAQVDRIDQALASAQELKAWWDAEARGLRLPQPA